MKLLDKDKLIYDAPPPEGWKLFKKYLKLRLFDLRYREGRFCFKISEEKLHYISLCAIFKNEAPFMKEWLEYHLLMGVNHFYLYNNNSEDDYFSVLEPYIDKGIVTLNDWPENPGQLSAYTHFYNTYRHESQWVSFLDLDEFICPTKAKDIPTWLKDYEKYPVIMMYWRMFGTSGKMRHDASKLVTEQYVVCWDKLDVCGKLLWNTDYDIDQLHIGMWHNLNVRKAGKVIPPVNVWKYFVKYNIHRTKDTEPTIQVNHYWSKAYDSFQEKLKRGDSAFIVSWRTFDKFLVHENHSISCDYTIYRFLVQLKLKMQEVR